MSKRVLIADDNAENIRSLNGPLTAAGFIVATACNGAECLMAAGEQPPDLIVLDTDMPVLNGQDTLRLLRQHPDLRDLPVILVSDSDAEIDVRLGWSATADMYLTRPVSARAVTAAANWLLRNRSRRHAE